MDKRLLFVLLAYAALIRAQDQSGFISIDCGIPNNSNYTDVKTGIHYVSDAQFIDTGVSKSIAPSYKTSDLAPQYFNVRSFPEGSKNCYTLTPPQKKDHSRYFVRAGFMYGNYDNKNQAPLFDIYLGVNYWDTVYSSLYSPVSKEILYNPSSSNYTYVCLVNTGSGTPFISVLELRLVNDSIYTTQTGSSLAVFGRYDIRAYDNRKIIRYGDDIIDRVWSPSFFYNRVVELNTTLNIASNDFTLPFTVMSNAIAKPNATDSLDFYWQPVDSTTKYFIYMHFADFQSSQIREFNITLNDKLWFGPFKPSYLSTTTLYKVNPETPATLYNFSFIRTLNSELPPMLNAIEIYYEKDLQTNPQTNQQDVDAIKSIKLAYGVVKNWQGDPCTPDTFSWLGINCSNDASNIPRIISLNMSFSGLTGTISPYILNLDVLKSLDLSNNSLTGEVPIFLAQMKTLSVLNLSGNNFTGTIPSTLIKRSTDGSLQLSVDGNPYLCKSEPCKTKDNDAPTPPPPATPIKDKKNDHHVPIFAGVASLIVVIVLLGFLWITILIKRIKLPPQQQGTSN